MEATKFLDNIGTAHMEEELTKRVMTVAKRNSATLQEQSGIQPSIGETEIKEYLNEVMLEVARAKHKED